MRSVAVEHLEQPVEGLRLRREAFDNFEAVLVDLGYQHALDRALG